MNAETSINIDIVPELDDEGISLVMVFPDDGSTAEFFSWDDIIEDMFEMSSLENDGKIPDADKEYLMSVAASMTDAANTIRTRVIESI